MNWHDKAKEIVALIDAGRTAVAKKEVFEMARKLAAIEGRVSNTDNANSTERPQTIHAVPPQ